MAWSLFWQLMILVAWVCIWTAITAGAIRGKKGSA